VATVEDRITESPLTAEESAALEAGTDPTATIVIDNEQDDVPVDDLISDPPQDEDTTHKIPDWAVVPPKLQPPDGIVMAFLRIPAAWTMRPSQGDRHCIVWPLDESEEIRAYDRSRGSRARSTYELAKGCVRAVDGAVVSWGTGARELLAWWRDIGPKGRSMIMNYYVKQHVVGEDEALDFFSNHFAAVTAQRG
jgi:hypothetical protein